MKAKERQLLFSFTGAMVSTVVLYLLFSWWAPLLVWFSLSVWVTALFCYPIMYPARKVSFINYAMWMTLYFIAFMSPHLSYREVPHHRETIKSRALTCAALYRLSRRIVVELIGRSYAYSP